MEENNRFSYPPVTDESARPRRRRVSPLVWILGLSAILFFSFILVFGGLLIRGAKRSGGTGSIVSVKEKIGILEINGIILDSKKTLKDLDEFEEDLNVKGVVLRLNSPGGAVAPSQEIYQAVKKFPKPLVVSMSSVAASGAYYIAAGSKHVFANPGTITGSIGVIMQFTNLEKLYDWAKVTRYSIKTGKFKDAGADYRQMTAEEKELLQGMVDDTLVQFKSAVAEGRKLTQNEVDAVADGRIFSGSQAKAVKLVDSLGGIEDAIAWVKNEAKIQGDPKIIYPEKPKKRFIEWFFSDYSDESESLHGVSGPAVWLTPLVRQIFGLPKTINSLEPGIYWLLPWGA